MRQLIYHADSAPSSSLANEVMVYYSVFCHMSVSLARFQQRHRVGTRHSDRPELALVDGRGYRRFS